MDPLYPQRRLPAFEDTDAYRALCADRGTTPIRRPADGGQAYVGDDDDALAEALALLEPHRPQPAIGVPPGGLLPGGHDYPGGRDDDQDDYEHDH